MKVLLDENVPETLTAAFDRCETLHVNELGWQGKENGASLLAAQEAGFTALVTTDVNLYNQQKARLHAPGAHCFARLLECPAGILPLVPTAQATGDGDAANLPTDWSKTAIVLANK